MPLTIERIEKEKQESKSYKLNSVLCGDALKFMENLPDDSFDIAIADPPYNLSKGNNWQWDNSVKLPGFGGNWNKVMQNWDSMPLTDYFQFTLKWIAELKRIIKPTGSLWIHGTYHNIGIINFALQLLEVEIINEIVWYKRNSFPNLSRRRLTASHETILWAHTGKKRQYLFNYDALKTANFPEDNLHTLGKQMRTVWDIPNNKERAEIQFGKHPTQKPLRLLRRMLKISSQSGQSCLIPFGGAGSECVACAENNVNFLAFELDKSYVEIANKRLSDVTNSLFTDDNYRNSLKNNMQEVLDTEPINHGSSSNNNHPVPSLIKWTGSKRKQAPTIKSYFPDYDRYFEPFLGGGALLFLNTDKTAIASDLYEPLIKLWVLIKEDVNFVIESYQKNWALLQEDLPDYFYKVRDRYNKQNDPLDLLFLTRTCVNGIVRFNGNGEFNNSFHLSRKGMLPDKFAKIAKEWSERIKFVGFQCADYKAILSQTKRGDLVYLDPPYSGNKARYIADLDKDAFFAELDKLNTKGVKFVLSFDGFRNGIDLRSDVPKSLYKREVLISNGNSAVKKVLSGQNHSVEESLYLNY